MLKLWFVDDMPQNRQTWLQSFPDELRQRHEFQTFESVEALFAGLQSQAIPDILFIDYYIGPRRGHEVVNFFRDRRPRPLLIAHSSMEEANQVMLRYGADLSFEKTPGTAVTRSITENIRNEQDLHDFLGCLPQA